MTRALIFDVPGGIHDALSRALTEEGWQVEVDTATDMSAMRAVRQRAITSRPDAVLMLASWDDLAGCERDSERAFQRNAEDAIHVAAAARELGAIPVLLSPAEVYGQNGGPFTESDAPVPTCVWATTRLRGEVLMTRAAPSAIVLRTGPIVAGAAIKGPIELADKGRCEPVDVRFVAHAIARLVAARASGTFHLSGFGADDERPTRAEVFALVRRPKVAGVELGRAPMLLAEKIRPFLSLSAPPWRDGLRTEEVKLGQKEQVRRVEKPWGYEIIWAHSERYVGKLLFIRAGERLSLQYHVKKDETVYVLSGKMLFEVGPKDGEREDLILKPGDAYRITPETVHRMIAIEDTQVLEASTPELDDVVRLEDKYGRAGTSKA